MFFLVKVTPQTQIERSKSVSLKQMTLSSTEKKENWSIAGKKKQKLPLFLQMDAVQCYQSAYPSVGAE